MNLMCTHRGMPTSIQSAPARCEFRGGIESYCKAASSVLCPTGTFIVCENWLNNHRVYSGAKEAGLDIVRVYPIKGNLKKRHNLFAVYVMKKEKKDNSRKRNDSSGDLETLPKIFETISVRDNDGCWTAEYKKIMNAMSIP